MSDTSCNEKEVPSYVENSQTEFWCKTYANIVILTMVIFGVWVLFLIPIILFSTRSVENVSQNMGN
jgi:hypothetical protein